VVALALRGKRLLPADAAQLPLRECTRQDRCSCKDQHYRDRRGAARPCRAAGASDPGQRPAIERRRPGEQREPRS
jgi:hypothetical protein